MREDGRHRALSLVNPAEQLVRAARSEVHDALKRLIRLESIFDRLEGGMEAYAASDEPIHEVDGAAADMDMEFMVSLIIYARKARNHIFPDGVFSDPAWDMLLDLYLNSLKNRSVPVSSLCIAASAPPTTAFRRIDALERLGLVRRGKDEEDGRRVLVELTDAGAEAMSRTLEATYRAMTMGNIGELKRQLIKSL